MNGVAKRQGSQKGGGGPDEWGDQKGVPQKGGSQ